MHIGIDATALPAQPAGAGIYIINLVRALAALDSGHELTVFVERGKYPLFGLSPNDKLHFIQVQDKPPWQRLIWEQTFFPALVRRAGVDLLHSPHYTMPLALPCRSVVTFHDMIFFIYPQYHTLVKRYFFRWFIRVSGRWANALIADSESTRRDAIKLAGVPAEKIHTVHLGVTDEFRTIRDVQVLDQIKAKYQLPENFLLYVGVMEPRKNLAGLLKAYQTLVAEGIQQHLVIAGGKGWMIDQVLASVAESEMKARIHFTGHVPHEDLPAIFNLAEVFVYPSLYEGFGIPVLEALACATPVVTSNISSIPEITGDCALLIPPTDQQALTSALQRLLKDKSLRQDLARCGPERAAYFTWTHTARRTLAVYQQILAH
jgi:glycosyltransferase involved in cell wall biosynthesis